MEHEIILKTESEIIRERFIEARRKYLLITMSKEINVDLSHLSKVLNGKVTMTKSTGQKIRQYLDKK